jgi:gliding motility-associated protein GldM
MALPKEPRQKMINLMYLVLTALLALNVSAEILNAFKTVERSLGTTNTIINASTETILKSFEEVKKTDPSKKEKADYWQPKALAAQALAKDMNDYINGLKAEIMKGADFDPVKNGDSTFKEDNQEVATRIMVEEGKGQQLRARLEKYKKDMAAIAPELSKDIEKILTQINLDIPPSKNKSHNTWETAYFEMVPTVAATTMLTKFQNDIKTTENRAIARFYQQVGEVVVVFDNYATIKGQNATYLMPGQELAVTAGVGAFSSKAAPTITIGGKTIPVNDKGVAEFKQVVNSIGQGSIPVHYEWTDQEGKRQSFDDKIIYEVGQSNAAIALPEMNVMYIGWPNQVIVSGGGVGAEKIGIKVAGGGASFDGGNGKFTVRVSQQTDNCIVTAYNKQDGKTLGALTFRVRQMPSPLASVGGKRSGDGISAAALAAQPGVAANIENFPLRLTYTVTRFKVVGTDENSGDLISIPGTGNLFTPQMKAMIRNQKPGEIITVEDIYCTGPDGATRKLPSLLYNIL